MISKRAYNAVERCINGYTTHEDLRGALETVLAHYSIGRAELVATIKVINEHRKISAPADEIPPTI